jgi:cell division protein FtsB
VQEGILQSEMKRKKLVAILDSRFFSRVKKEATRKKGKLKTILFLVGLALLAYLYLAGDYGFIRIFSLWKEKKNLQMEIKKIEAKTIDLKVEKNKLTTDLHYIERIARERYGLAKKGEKIYKFVQKEPKDLSK